MYNIIGTHGLAVFQGDWEAIVDWVAKNGLEFVLRIISV